MQPNASFIIVIMTVWLVSADKDTSYQPPEASGGPYPASGKPVAAPYPSSGWKPNGKLLMLPARQTTPNLRISSNGIYGTPPKTTTNFAIETEFTTIESVTSPKPEVQIFFF